MTRRSSRATECLTEQHQSRSKISVNQDREGSPVGHLDQAEFELDLNDIFIQSIEELLPEYEQNRGRPATTPLLSSQISSITPGQPIKVEKLIDLGDDVYNASPQDHVYKAAEVGRRRTSRSTAQLTTPDSSPDRKRELCNTVAGASFVKLEAIHDGNEGGNAFETSCTPPASSSEDQRISKRPANTELATTSQRPPSRAFQTKKPEQDSRKSSMTAEQPMPSITLPTRRTIGKNGCLEESTVFGQINSAKIAKPKKSYEKPGECEPVGRKSPIECPPILPPPKVSPLVSKSITHSDPVMNASSFAPIAGQSILTGSDITIAKTPDKQVCVQHTASTVVMDHSRRSPEKRPHISRLKSPSACPSSVSSFGPGDDIPPSAQMHFEVRRAVAESTKTFASSQISEASPSLRYTDRLTRLGTYNGAPSDTVVNGVYEDFDEDSLLQKNPYRVIFGKTGHKTPDRSEANVSLSRGSRRSASQVGGQKEGKRLQQILCRSLRSFSAANDLSKKASIITQDLNRREKDDGENEQSHYSVDSGDFSTDESSSEYEEVSSRKEARADSLKGKACIQSSKRAREVLDEWQPRFSDDEDLTDEDEIVEINRDVFEMSSNKRKKRHKIDGDISRVDPVLASPAPKEEPVEENDDISLAERGSGTTEPNGNNSAETVEQEKTPCEHYLSTYWEHGGGANDGRHRAQDGFISYAGFKTYCRENKQPTDDACIVRYKTDLKHYLRCAFHAAARPDLHRAAWNFEHNPGFSFRSCSRDQETRRLQDEAIGNAPGRPRLGCSSPRGPAAPAVDGQVAEIVSEVMRAIGSSHAADVAQLKKSKKELERTVKGGLKTRLTRLQRR